MAAWVVWVIFAGVAALLGFVGYHFSVRTLRWVAGVAALGSALAITAYGLTLGSPKPSNLESSFELGADRVAAAFFNQLGRGNPPFGLGQVGWVVIVILLVLGYRMLEVWALHWQAPQLDVSKLGEGQPSITPSGKRHGLVDGLTDGQRHDQLAAALRFRLAAMEVRAPAILPGGSRSGGLASIAEASGVEGAGLAGAIIRFFGLLWPNPRQVLLRVWVEQPTKPADPSADQAHSTRVTAELDNPRTGETIATKTLAAENLDEAATRVAGYVARQIFGMDPATPPWCTGLADGSDLAALLRSRQERVTIRTPKQMEDARSEQIKLLERASTNTRWAGVVRYELAQLYSIQGPPSAAQQADEDRHLTALRLHAVNREQYRRFYRGRYRLGMSLEMIANPDFRVTDHEKAAAQLNEVLAILRRSRAMPRQSFLRRHQAAKPASHKGYMVLFCHDGNGKGAFQLSPAVRLELLAAAQQEFRAVRRQLTLGHVLWAGFAHRDERAIWLPYVSGLRLRQSFHDAACVAELLVAVRRRQNGARPEAGISRDAQPKEAQSKEKRSPRLHKPRRLKQGVRVSSAIAGDADLLWSIVQGPPSQWPPPPPSPSTAEPADPRDRTRWLPWQRGTASWQAAYTTACLYAALASKPLASKPLASKPLAPEAAWQEWVVVSLGRAVNNPRSEMERASDWISRDPDFSALRSAQKPLSRFKQFLADQVSIDYEGNADAAPAAPAASGATDSTSPALRRGWPPSGRAGRRTRRRRPA